MESLDYLGLLKSKIKAEMKKKNYDKVIYICDNSEMSNNIEVKMFKIKALTENRNYKEALIECETILKDKYYQSIETSRIEIIKRTKGYQAAIKECLSEKNRNSNGIKLALVGIYREMEDYSGLLEYMASDPFFNQPHFNEEKEKIRKLIKDDSIEKELLTKVYGNYITKEEIDNANINEYRKDILILAYLEKNNKKKALEYAKVLKKKYIEKEDIKNINVIINKITTNKRYYYDIGLYENILNTEVDFNLLNRIKEIEESEEEISTKDDKLIIECFKDEFKSTVKIIRTNNMINLATELSDIVNCSVNDKEALTKFIEILRSLNDKITINEEKIRKYYIEINN